MQSTSIKSLLAVAVMATLSFNAYADNKKDDHEKDHHESCKTCKPVTLFNTGVDDEGKKLGKDAQDEHYTVTYQKAVVIHHQTSYVPVTVDAEVGRNDINSAWLADSKSDQSAWVTPFQAANLTLDPSKNGEYVYTQTFDLTGYSLTDISFSGRWAADNYGTMFLNGHEIASISKGTGASAYSNFQTWHDFTSVSSSYFVEGKNTITWDVINIAQSSGNPTGLRVEFTDFNKTCISAVPEPSAWALMIAGFALIGFVSNRRRENV